MCVCVCGWACDVTAACLLLVLLLLLLLAGEEEVGGHERRRLGEAGEVHGRAVAVVVGVLDQDEPVVLVCGFDVGRHRARLASGRFLGWSLKSLSMRTGDICR